MGRLLGGFVLVAALALPAAPALAEDSFSGSCKDIEGTAKFDTPLTNTVSDNVYHFAGTGTCTGKLNGADITDSPIAAQVDGPFSGSCEGSESTAPGPGKLVFGKGTAATGDDVTVSFKMTFTGTASEIDFTLAGTKAGTATGHATFVTPRTPPDLVAKCLAGGNGELPFDATSNAGTLSSESAGTAPGQATQTGGQQTSGGGSSQSTGTTGGGSSSSAQDGSGGAAGGAPAAGLDIPAQSLRDVLARGLRVTCRGEGNCVVKVRLAKKAGKKLKLTGAIASGRGTVGIGTGQADVVARLTGAARRKLRAQRSVSITVTATIGGRNVTRNVTLKR